MTTIPNKEELSLLMKAECHRGSSSLSKAMSPYVFKKSEDGRSFIFDLYKTWQKIHAAARLLAAVREPSDICLAASTNWAQRAIFKFAQYTKSYSVSGRFTPGTLTNQVCRKFREPSVLVVCDPKLDFQPIKEASYVNIPVIALCDTDSPLEYVDMVIPCNNKSKLAVATIFYLLCCQVKKMKGEITIDKPFDVPVDLFIYKTSEELQQIVDSDNAKLEKMRQEEKQSEGEEEVEKEGEESEVSEDEAANSLIQSTPGNQDDNISEEGALKLAKDSAQEPSQAYNRMGASISAGDTTHLSSEPSQTARVSANPSQPSEMAQQPFFYPPNMAYPYFPQQGYPPQIGRDQAGGETRHFAYPQPTGREPKSGDAPPHFYPPHMYGAGPYQPYIPQGETGFPSQSAQGRGIDGKETSNQGVAPPQPMRYPPQSGFMYYPPYHPQSGQMYPPYNQGGNPPQGNKPDEQRRPNQQ